MGPVPVLLHQGQRLHYEVSGAGPALLLGHSFLCSGAMWHAQVTSLERRYRIVNPDLRGHGASAPITAPFTLYDAVDDALAILVHLQVARAVWIGLSIGN